jgi:hypothetical protein
MDAKLECFKRHNKIILVFERKILRSIFGPCINTNTRKWRIRHNVKIRELYQKPNKVEDIRKRQLLFWLTTHGERKMSLYTSYYVALQKA